MRIRKTRMKDGGLGKEQITYRVDFQSKREISEKEGVDMRDVSFYWNYIDDNPTVPVEVSLTEVVDVRTRRANLTAIASYQCTEVGFGECVDHYMTLQVEQIVRAGGFFINGDVGSKKSS